MGKKAGKNLSKIPIVIADVNDEKSLVEMAKQAKIIVNCCGPYRHWGEQVVKACIEAGTHHVDVSGEPQYIETMQLKYNDQARQKGIYIVSACGFDSIPAEMGTIFLQEKFNGTVNSVETYLRLYSVDENIENKATLNIGTWESAVQHQMNINELSSIHRKLFPTKTPQFLPKLKRRVCIHKFDDLWCLPFSGPDRSVILRSQRHFNYTENLRPAQIQSYIGFKKLSNAFKFMFYGSIFTILAKFSCTAKLLMKYPKFFSCGLVTRDTPAEAQSNNLRCELIFQGQGWKEKRSNPNQHSENHSENKKFITKVSVVNPAYGATCSSLLLAAKMILRESNRMPGTGGVLPPGAAFKNTNLIDELQKHGFTFEVVRAED
jgi:short subunit dehydrogenase-like uncharacterized protein